MSFTPIQYPYEPQSRFTQGDVRTFMRWAYETKCSDITIQTDWPIMLEIQGYKHFVTRRVLSQQEVLDFITHMFGDNSPVGKLAGGEDVNFAFDFRPERDLRYRFRVNASSCAVEGGSGASITCRTITAIPPTMDDLKVEQEIRNMLSISQGLILICGGTGSGKSTLLSSFIRGYLEDPDGHKKILTFEHPIEYVYDEIRRQTSLIAQHEIGKHQQSFIMGTVSSLRRKPDIILIGESRDAAGMEQTLVASNTGHLVFTTVHTNGFPETFKRIVAEFPHDLQNSRLSELVSNTKMVVCQRLVRGVSGGRVALREYVIIDDVVKGKILNTNLDLMVPTCQGILLHHGKSFVDDAALKFKEGLISEKVFNDIVVTMRGRQIDAESILIDLARKSDALKMDLSK